MPIQGLRGASADDPKVVTTRCFACDTFFEARTVEAVTSLLESHKAREHLVLSVPSKENAHG